MSKSLFLAAGLIAGATAFVAPEHGDISIARQATTTFAPNYAKEQVGFVNAQRRFNVDPETIAREAVAEQLGKSDLMLTSKYASNTGVTHVYFAQTVNGLEVSNAAVNVNVDAEGRVISIGSSGLTSEQIMAQESRLLNQRVAVEPLAAVKSFLKFAYKYEGEVTPAETQSSLKGDHVSFTFKGDAMSKTLAVEEQTVEARLMYTVDQNDELQLTWAVNVESEQPHYAHYVAQMSATGESEPVEVYDQVKWFTYEAFGAPATDPYQGPNGPDNSQGPIQPRVIVSENKDARVGSPNGWHTDPSGTRRDTWGNNVRAQENRDGTSGYINNRRPSAGSRDEFEFDIDYTVEPTTREVQDAAISNLFSWSNEFHDIMYAYGWNEVAGNMQEDNYGLGGIGGDALQTNAQDGAGFNNANQATPADGGRGRMRMYLWNQVRPMKDGDFDSGIVIHEYAHSLSNRLTGGPSRANCLGNGQSGGMGEGWGDFLATMWSQRQNFSEEQSFPMGLYAADRGIRPYPYSADMRVNPTTYRDVGRTYNAVHAVGHVWCNTLMDVYWGMKRVWGFEPDIYKVDSEAANVVLVQLVTDGMKLQPCTPNIVQARDAIMQADAIRYDGKHQCEMWKRFAKRGLGEFASTTGTGFGTTTEDFTVPARCL